MMEHAVTVRDLMKWGALAGGGILAVGGFGFAALMVLAAMGSDAPSSGDGSDIYIPAGLGAFGAALFIAGFFI